MLPICRYWSGKFIVPTCQPGVRRLVKLKNRFRRYNSMTCIDFLMTHDVQTQPIRCWILRILTQKWTASELPFRAGMSKWCMKHIFRSLLVLFGLVYFDGVSGTCLVRCVSHLVSRSQVEYQLRVALWWEGAFKWSEYWVFVEGGDLRVHLGHTGTLQSESPWRQTDGRKVE